MVFCDTDLLVIKIWSEHSFGYCPDWILRRIEQQQYDLVLLLNVDLPWEPDPLREHPHHRQYFLRPLPARTPRAVVELCRNKRPARRAAGAGLLSR